jgi:hypothetical protein
MQERHDHRRDDHPMIIASAPGSRGGSRVNATGVGLDHALADAATDRMTRGMRHDVTTAAVAPTSRYAQSDGTSTRSYRSPNPQPRARGTE